MCVCVSVSVCTLVVAGLVRGRCGQEAKVAGFVCVVPYMYDMHTYVHIHMQILVHIYIYTYM